MFAATANIQLKKQFRISSKTDMTDEQRIYYPELDSLRFLAFLAVFIHHAPVLPIPGYDGFWRHTWVGVDLFLCLSAFLFVHLLGAEWRQTGTIGVGHFYIRRGLRIWPVYFLYVAAVALVTLLSGSASPENLARLLSAASFTANIHDALAGYNNHFPVLLLLHLWTISYEEQFYLFIPWFLRLLFPKTRRTQLGILAGVCAVGLAARTLFLLLDIRFPAIYVLPVTHFESILLGLLIGLGLPPRLLERVPAWVLGLAGLTSFYAVARLPYYWENTPWLMLTYVLVGLGSAALLVMALRAPGSRGLGWMASKPLVYLGKISYGLYLYHYASIYCAKELLKLAGRALPLDTGISNALAFVLAMGLSVLLAALSYRFIESPFLRRKQRFAIIPSRAI